MKKSIEERLRDRENEVLNEGVAAHCAGYKFSHRAIVSGYLGATEPVRVRRRRGRGGVLRCEIHIPSLLTGDKHNHRMEVWVK